MRSTLVILAAGAGARYGGLKQLAPVGPHGETLLEYSAFDALRAGFDRIVLVVRADTETAFRERLGSGLGARASLVYAHQRAGEGPGSSAGRHKPWGTAHAVLAAEPHLEGPFAVANADDFYGYEPFAAVSQFLARAGHGRRLAVVGFPVAGTLTDAGAVSRAVLEVGEGSRLRDLVELLEVWKRGDEIRYRDREGKERGLAGGEVVSMNLWGLSPELLPELRRRFERFRERCGDPRKAEFRLPDVIRELVRESLFEVEVLASRARWCGLTFSDDEERVRSRISSLIGEGRYPEALWT